MIFVDGCYGIGDYFGDVGGGWDVVCYVCLIFYVDYFVRGDDYLY